jgi:hypothetical protein
MIQRHDFVMFGVEGFSVIDTYHDRTAVRVVALAARIAQNIDSQGSPGNTPVDLVNRLDWPLADDSHRIGPGLLAPLQRSTSPTVLAGQV